MKRVLRFAAVATLLCVAGAAGAQAAAPTAEEIKLAAEEFDLGRKSFKAKDYVEAAEHFEAADRNAPSATALELALRSRDKADQLDRAATLATLALERHPDERGLSKLANDVLARAKKALHQVNATCDTPCDLVTDNKIVHGGRATQREVFLTPGSHRISAGWSGGRADSEEIEATAGGSSDVSFEEPPEEKPEPAVTPPPATTPGPTGPEKDPGPKDEGGGLPPAVFWIGAGLTVVAGGATVWSGIDTQNNPGADRVREECAGQGEECALYQDGLDRQRRTNYLAIGTAGIGVITVLIGAFATDWGGDDEESAQIRPTETGFAVSPWIGVGDGATLGATGRF